MRCELLSNHYLCANKNSLIAPYIDACYVVNCFQIIIFVLTRTAYGIMMYFKFGCELLSNHYLCANKNSFGWVEHCRILVVNCFQIIIFVLTRTAISGRRHLDIFVLTRTAISGRRHLDASCELLSNHYLCANKNSLIPVWDMPNTVVNCFQIIIFVLTRTAPY